MPPCDFVPSCFCQAVAVRADVVSGHSPPPRGVKPVCSACPGCQGRGQAWQGRPSSRRLRARVGGGPTTSIPGVPVFSIPRSSEEAVGPRRPPPPSAAHRVAVSSAAGSSGQAGGRLCPSLPPAATAGGSALISRARVVTLGSLCQGQRGHVTTRSQEWCLITSNVLGVRAGWYPEGHNSDPTCSYFKIPRLVKCVILFFALENLVYFPHFCLTLTSVRAASTVCPVTAVPESSTERGMEQGAGITAFVKRMTGRGKE